MAMNGMDKIAARIRADAQAEADALTAQAETKAAEIRKQAEQDAQTVYEKLLADGDTEAEKEYALLVAAADTQSKKVTLALKQELLGKAFQMAVRKLCSLDGADYIRLLASLAVHASETGEEAVILNPRDRIAYGAEIVKEANRRSGKKLTLSEETRPIVGGLILSQGRIEVNCALDTLAELRRSQLSVQAAKKLFD